MLAGGKPAKASFLTGDKQGFLFIEVNAQFHKTLFRIMQKYIIYFEFNPWYFLAAVNHFILSWLMSHYRIRSPYRVFNFYL
ncbi:hypothetical protein BBB57_11810 [Kosakonia sacchari]|nr:hypothetical protein BBB57_11810 [Kosakonia sacchari]